MEAVKDHSASPAKPKEKKTRTEARREKTTSVTKKGRKESTESFTCKLCSKEYKNRGSFLKHTELHSRNQEPSCQKNLIQRSTDRKKGKEKEENFVARQKSGMKITLRKRSGGKDKIKVEKRQEESESESDFLSDENLIESDCDPNYLGCEDTEKSEGCSKDGTNFKCKVCSKRLASAVTLSAHMRTHNGEKLFSCKLCHKTFRRQDQLKVHIKRHSAPDKFNCEICGEGFKRQDHLRYHKVNNHEGIIYLNELKVFNKTQKERQEKTFLCEVCGKGFVDQNRLKVHREIHSEVKKYQCKFCPKSFSYSSNYNVHMRLHTGKNPYKCVVCGDCFRTSSRLKTHTRKHTGEYPYVCEVCGKLCGEKNLLKMHMQTHNNQKLYECPHCSKSFTHSSTLRSHIRLHTGSKPYECQICGHKFAQLSSLNYHKRTHTGEKPFTCHICGTSYTRKTTLTSHLLRHAGTKNVSCSSCDFMCYTSRQLRKHKASHHSTLTEDQQAATEAANSARSEAHINPSTSKSLVPAMPNYAPINEPVMNHDSDVSPVYCSKELHLQIPPSVMEKSGGTPAAPPSVVGFVSLDSANQPAEIGISASDTAIHPTHDYTSVNDTVIKSIRNVDQVYYNFIQGYSPSSYAVQQGHPHHRLSETLGDSSITPSQPVMESCLATVSNNPRPIPSSSFTPSSLENSGSTQNFNPVLHYSQVHNTSITNLGNFSRNNSEETLPHEGSLALSTSMYFQNTSNPVSATECVPVTYSHRDQMSSPVIIPIHPGTISHSAIGSERIGAVNTQKDNIWLKIGTSSKNIPPQNRQDSRVPNSLLEDNLTSLPPNPYETASRVEKMASHLSHKDTVSNICHSSPSVEDLCGDDTPTEDVLTIIPSESISVPTNLVPKIIDDLSNTTNIKGTDKAETTLHLTTDEVNSANIDTPSNVTNAVEPKKRFKEIADAVFRSKDKDQNHQTNEAAESENVVEIKAENAENFDTIEDDQIDAVAKSKRSRERQSKGKKQTKAKSKNKGLIVKLKSPLTRSKRKQQLREAEDGKTENITSKKLIKAKPAKKVGKVVMKIGKEKHKKVDIIKRVKQKMYTCDKCEESFLGPGLLALHKQNFHRKKEYECQECGSEFFSEGQLNKHISKFHSKPKRLTCVYCFQVIFSKELLLEHMESEHTGQKPFSCNVCQLPFLDVDGLKHHVKSNHYDIDYKCHICNETFEKSKFLKDHMSSRHEGSKAFICQTCDKSFAECSLLVLHNKHKHSGTKPYKCNLCSKVFVAAAKLQNHLRAHTGDKPFTCEFCGKVFAHLSLLSIHVKAHSSEKPFVCDQCNQAFTHKSTLIAHIRIHTGAKPFKCDLCGKGFAQLSSLNYHKKSHDGLKPFTCDQCGKSFTRSTTLKTHLMQHDGKKRFSCDLCDFKCNRKHALTKHHSKKHSESAEMAEKVIAQPEPTDTSATSLSLIQSQPLVENRQKLEKDCNTNNTVVCISSTDDKDNLQYRELQPAISTSLSPYLHLAIPNSPFHQLQLPQQQNNNMHQQQQQEQQQQQVEMKPPVQPVSLYISEQKEFYSTPIPAPFFYPLSHSQPEQHQLHTIEVLASSPSPPPHTVTMLGQAPSGMQSFPVSLQNLPPFHHQPNSNN